jgi:hypothetical protein
MELATLQRELLGLIKFSHKPAEDDDPYILAVASSKHLEMVQEIILWWRAYSLERYCIFTSTVLKRLGIFEDAVRSFIATHKLSPFIQKLGPSFLDAMSSHEIPLVASVAQFEHALISVKSGESTVYEITWDCEPNQVISSLLNSTTLDVEALAGDYKMVVSREFLELFRVLPAEELALPSEH